MIVLLFLGGFFSENGFVVYMIYYCMVYYCDVLVMVFGGVIFIFFFVFFSIMFFIGGRSGWKGMVCFCFILLFYLLLYSKEYFFWFKYMDGFFCLVRYMI